VVSRYTLAAPIPRDTRVLYLLVPGMLGFGWEWDAPLRAMRAAPQSAVQAFDWRPSSPVARVAGDLARAVDALFSAAPPSLRQVVIIGHSAGGIVTAQAAGLLRVPPGRAVLIANIGAPYAGMHTTFVELPPDLLHCPFAIAIGGEFRRYPTPAPRVSVESWVTPWPGDPVMKPRFGHHPDNPAIGPPGPRHVAPVGTDHNKYLAEVVRELVKRMSAPAPLRAH
jgi:pimeloyl-ACP methyl ester carboxylesterase